MADWSKHFASAQTYEQFLNDYAQPPQADKWASSLARVNLNETQTATLTAFQRELNVLCLAGAWCGDCAEQCPILQRFALTTDRIQLRFLDRDADKDAQQAFLLCGAPRVPQVVFLSEDMTFLGHYGDRTLTRYRQLGQSTMGSVCSTGLAIGQDPVFEGVVQDWLNEFERAHWIVRLSPRLRQKHND